MNKKSKVEYAIVATDIVILTILDGDLCSVVAKVNRPPHYVDIYGFLGGLILPAENTDESIKRILKEKYKIKSIYFEQLKTFSEVDRDKRGRVVSVAYLGLCNVLELDLSSPFYEVRKVSNLKKLAYDHAAVLKSATARLESKVEYTNIIQKLIKETFTFSELQKIYEGILKKDFDKRNFRKKIESINMLEETGKKVQTGKMRPAKEYRFKSTEIKTFKLFGEF